MYFSRRKLLPRPAAHSGELNLVPFLDITVNLVMFLLLSITGLLEFAVVRVGAPAHGPDVAGPEPRPLLLSVMIARSGFFVGGAGAILGDGEGPTIPLRNGALDQAALAALLSEVKRAHPTETRLVLAADPDVRYELVVETLDTARGTPTAALFPEVSLATL